MSNDWATDRFKESLDEQARLTAETLAGWLDDGHRWKAAQETHPRAIKLLESGKFFLVVSETEPYFARVYLMIRQQEIAQGTWTEDCEATFQEHVVSEGGEA